MVGIDLSFHPNLHADLSTLSASRSVVGTVGRRLLDDVVVFDASAGFLNRRVEAAETVAYADAEAQEVVLAHAQRTEIVGVGLFAECAFRVYEVASLCRQCQAVFFEEGAADRHAVEVESASVSLHGLS